MSIQENGQTQTDPLGYDVYARTLWTRIQAALNKDLGSDGQTKPLGDDPLVVGIFGEWGAGKSHLLKLIQKLAEQASKDQMAQRCLDPQAFEGAHTSLAVTVPVYFQPWKYEHEAHLHIPLAVHVADAMHKAWKDLRTGKEDVLAKIDELGKQANTAQATIEKAKSTWDKASELMGQAEKALKSKTVQVVAAAADIGLASVGAPPLIGLARKKLIGYTSPEDSEDTDEDEEGESTKGDATSKANPKAEASTAKEEPKKTVSDSLAHKDDGLSFYRTDRLLHDLTRPKANKAFLKGMGVGVASEIEYDLRINFVVFIDDLDRCLPEKAVQTLELIKTVFNVESFAFVLALDDEVIERGIGHRYKEYKLQDKKPEMPITGFEYLEKIVHLPFRLPGLTREQAQRFIVDYEARTAQAGEFLWFSQVTFRKTKDESTSYVGDRFENKPLDLLWLVIASFDAYAPRKLIRIVELMRQVMYVAWNEHGKPITNNGQALDIRVILALLLLQLFQPELYRLMRRRVDTFPALYGGFVRQGELDYPISDIDLWEWVDKFAKQGQGSNQDTSRVVDALNPYEATVQRIADIARTTDKAAAQYVRLPLVEQLVEHRAVQRHVFNPLRMMQELVKKLQPTQSLGDFSLYFNLLSANEAVQQQATPPIPKDQRQRQRFAVGQLVRLFEDLISTRAEVLDNLAERYELQAGHVLETQSVQGLYEQLQGWLSSTHPEEGLRASNDLQQERKQRLLRGLQNLAPYIAHDDGEKFWALAKDCGIVIPTEPNTPTPKPVQASLYLDVRSMLGQESRFNGPYAMLTDGSEALLNHFAFVPAETPLFALARTLTTVQQYKAFMDDGGYNPEAEWWSDDGKAWLSGKRQSGVDAMWLSPRIGDLRLKPWDWAEQLRIPHRPVHGITFFEAEAYANWLNTRLKPQLLQAIEANMPGATIRDCVVRLPTVEEWKQAATSGGWLGRKKSDQYANLNDKIKSPSVPGCFAPDQLGLYDMLGNLWEMQSPIKQTPDGKDIIDVCGGTWSAPSFIAQGFNKCIGVGIPSAHLNLVGFRVGLSVRIDNAP